jgi:hypothetical protein
MELRAKQFLLFLLAVLYNDSDIVVDAFVAESISVNDSLRVRSLFGGGRKCLHSRWDRPGRHSVVQHSSVVMDPCPKSDAVVIENDTGGGNHNNGGGHGGGNGKNSGHGDGRRHESDGDGSSDWINYTTAISSSVALATKEANGAIQSSTSNSASTVSIRLTTHAPDMLAGPLKHVQTQQAKVRTLVESFVEAYMAQLEARPMITKAWTSGVVGAIGDLVAQILEQKSRSRQQQKGRPESLESDLPDRSHHQFSFNAKRNLAIFLDGLLISGPLMHYGYDLFEHLAPIAKGGKTSSLNAMLHVVADSLVLDGVFVATAIVSSGLLEGYSLENEIVPQMQKDYIPAWKASLATSTLMAPIEFVAFKYLPLSLRTFAVNVSDIVWGAVMSHMAHRSRSDGEGNFARVAV